MPDDKDKKTTFTQEDLDRLVEDRLKRERAKYSDYDDLKAKAAKLDEAESKSKDESQKLLDRIAAAEKKAADAEERVGKAEADALRLSVAATKGLTPAQAKRLAGSTREELETDADELLESFKSEGGEGDGNRRPPPARPRENLKGGTDPTSEPVEMNPTKLAESVPRL